MAKKNHQRQEIPEIPDVPAPAPALADQAPGKPTKPTAKDKYYEVSLYRVPTRVVGPVADEAEAIQVFNEASGIIKSKHQHTCMPVDKPEGEEPETEDGN